MNRDMDLVRQIALAVADSPDGKVLTSLPDVSGVDFFFHASIMEEAGLIRATITPYLEGHGAAVIIRLTWDGCEFVDAVRSDTLWRKAKESVIRPTSSFTFSLLKDWLKAELQQGFPTLRGMSQ